MPGSRSLSFQVIYTNIGNEEARDLRLNISGIPAGIFRLIILSLDVSKYWGKNFRYNHDL